MKNFISINTVTNICSVSLFIKGEFIESLDNIEEFSHTKVLAPLVQEILIKHKLKIMNLDFVSLSVGPGSYSGIKVGVSFVKGIAISTGLPIVPVNQFLCFNDFISNKGYYYICLHSHRNNVFYQLFKNGIPQEDAKCNEYKVINLNHAIYGYHLDLISEIKYHKLVPSSKDIGVYAYKNYNSLLIDDPNKLESIYLVKEV